MLDTRTPLYLPRFSLFPRKSPKIFFGLESQEIGGEKRKKKTTHNNISICFASLMMMMMLDI